MQRLLLSTILLFIATGLHAQARTSTEPISYCELLRHASEYADKEVSVRATFRWGYEWSALYCLECPDETWVEFPPDFDWDSKEGKKLRRMTKHDGTGNVVLRGVFVTGHHYGHLGGYDHKFVVHSVQDSQLIFRESPGPASVPEKYRPQICSK